MELEISKVERQRAILELIERDKRASVPAICQKFSICEATARRDLDMLAREGKILRVRGGAIKAEQSPPELPILQREKEQESDKDRIGRAAAELIEPGDTVFFGSGTTVLATARYVKNYRKLAVITNSLPIINLLIGCSGINLIVIGGMVRPSELSFIGHITENALNEVRADKVILGARAISHEYGITNDYMAETVTDRAIIKIGKKVILVVDHTKFGLVSTAFLAPVEDIHVLVTDTTTDPEYIRLFRERSIQVITV